MLFSTQSIIYFLLYLGTLISVELFSTIQSAYKLYIQYSYLHNNHYLAMIFRLVLWKYKYAQYKIKATFLFDMIFNIPLWRITDAGQCEHSVHLYLLLIVSTNYGDAKCADTKTPPTQKPQLMRQNSF